jgi:UDP-N-acetylmuramyl pentapeptide phosphotransferase/UDP-N-acetylglucosamine-1-phosphate transferase
MFAFGDIALGILLGLSAFLLFIAVTSYRRSGVRSLKLMSVVLAINLSFTLFVIVGVNATDILDGIDGRLLLVLDVAILVVAVLIGLRGGKISAGPS